MGFRFIVASLFGASLFAAVYHVVLSSRSRSSALSLAAGLHAASAAAYGWALLTLVDAATVAAMQQAVDRRALAAMPLVVSATYMLAVFAELPWRRYVALAVGAVTVTVLGRIVEGTLGNDVTGLTQVVFAGEALAAPVRVTGVAHWMASVTVTLAAAFSLYCGWRLWRRDRPGGTLLVATGVTSLMAAPFVTVLQAWALPLQPMTLAPQVLFGLAAAMEMARAHDARAQAARAAERLHRAMFDQTFQMVTLLEPDGRVIDANRQALTLGRVTLAEVRGDRFEDTVGWRRSPDRERLRDALDAAAAGEVVRFEATHVSAQDQSSLVDLSIRPLRDGQGRVIRLIAEARDMTDERMAQEARQKIEAQLYQSQKLEAVGQLAGGIAHDFNNLLTVIHGFATLLASAPEFRTRQLELEQIQSASERAMSLTRQLLTFSTHAVTDAQVLHLDDLVHQVEALLRRLVGADVRMRLVLGGGVPAIKVDAAQLERVLVNLVVNARDAMPQGGVLEIETRAFDPARDTIALPRGGAWAVLSVRDTGTGMSPAVRARLFEPFFTTKGPGKGTGLGLAVVDRVVTQAHGVVDVTSDEGRGTTFRVYLPATDEPTAPAADVPRPPPVRGHETVLVVDDEPALRELAAATLAARGFDVLQAGSAAEAIAIVEAHAGTLHLLLSDVVMPGGSAMTIVESLRQRHPSARLLFMSGYPADEAVRRGVVTGEANFLQKPFTPDGLALRVRALLDQPQAPTTGA
jgi:PAS domain S-box-containing protein